MIRTLRTSGGFTFIELMVAMAIFGIIVAGIMAARWRQQEQNISQLQAVEMQQSARAVMFLIKRELRMAGYNPHVTDYGAGISVANTNDLTFSYVADEDCEDNNGNYTGSLSPSDSNYCDETDVDEEGELETITYALQDNGGDGDTDITVSHNGGSPQAIAENVLNFALTYFDNDGAPLTPPLIPGDDIKSIQITITTTTDVNELARATNNNTRTLTTRIYLRNMGL